VNFYKELYKHQATDTAQIKEYLLPTPSLSTPPPRISLSTDVIRQAILDLPDNKTPGIDGLTAGFYKTFISELSPLLVHFFNQIIGCTSLPLSLTQGVIALIHKKGEKSNIQNYRPITLLCLDSKILAINIRPTLTSIMHPHQYGFLPGRTIQDNLRFTVNYLLSAKSRPPKELLFLVDIRKAFDTLSRDFLFASLHHQGFPIETIHIIKLLHTNNCAIINVNGKLTKSFDVNSGVRQGCPLAPYLFILAINSLLHHIQISSITGISPSATSTYPVKIQAYADDLTLFITEQDIPKATSLLRSFGQLSNLHINLQKSTLLFCSKQDSYPTSLHNIPVLQNNQHTKILGITVSSGFTPNATWEGVIQKLNNAIAAWKGTKLTIYGRVRISQAYFQSIINFYASVLHIPSDIRQLIDTTIDLLESPSSTTPPS
jgi:Reverse transcriptase (RNA-dependent DNA polymerase)